MPSGSITAASGPKAAIQILLHREPCRPIEPSLSGNSITWANASPRSSATSNVAPNQTTRASVAESEAFVAVMAERIGKIPVQREHGILHQRIHAEMEALDRFAPSGNAFECSFELGEIL
jgi:hypothetical protein